MCCSCVRSPSGEVAERLVARRRVMQMFCDVALAASRIRARLTHATRGADLDPRPRWMCSDRRPRARLRRRTIPGERGERIDGVTERTIAVREEHDLHRARPPQTNHVRPCARRRGGPASACMQAQQRLRHRRALLRAGRQPSMRRPAAARDGLRRSSFVAARSAEERLRVGVERVVDDEVDPVPPEPARVASRTRRASSYARPRVSARRRAPASTA